MLQMRLGLEVVGDSHVARMEAARVRWPFVGRTNFISRSGGGISHLRRAVNIILRRPPHLLADVALIFLGGNDLDRSLNFFDDIHDLVNNYKREIKKLTNHGVMVIYMEQWPRPGARAGAIDFWSKISYFEYCLKKALPQGAWIWHWDKQMRFNEHFFNHDGVHCKYKYNKKFARYLCSAAIAAGRMFKNAVYS